MVWGRNMETAMKVVSPREAARQLGVQTSTIYSWIRNGILPAYKLPSGYFRIREVDLQAFLTPIKGKKEPGEAEEKN